MALNKKDLKGKKINCDDYSLVDFQDLESEDLFDVAEYFWEYIADGARKQYMIYGQPMSPQRIKQMGDDAAAHLLWQSQLRMQHWLRTRYGRKPYLYDSEVSP